MYMPSAEKIASQEHLLATQRRTLTHYLSQQTIHGLAYVPPAVIHGIAEARQQIDQLKASLRGWGVAVDDLPGDQPTETPSYAAGSPADTFTALHQLRAVVSDFVGREDEIVRVVDALGRATDRGTGLIGAVRGLGGSGKTELAYAVAQRLVARYPDAQIVIELRGAGSRPLPAHQALQQVIRAFEPQGQLPDDLNQLQALYRSLLTGKRALVFADDVRDAAQVRPLLPPPGSGLLITSRQRFSLPGMAVIDLGVLPQAAAEHMLLAICPRIGAEAARLAQLCGALPLALRVSAGVLASDATLPVERHIQALSSERARLARLRDPDDPDVDVEASLALSYDSLDMDAQDMLSQLSLFSASFDRPAAAAIVTLRDSARAEDKVTLVTDDVISVLYRRCLLEYDSILERFALHDLVRVFAAARLVDPAALHLRYAQHYLGVAQRADAQYSQGHAQMRAGLALFDRERAHIDGAWAWLQQQSVSQSIDELSLAYALATTYTGNLRYNKRRERIPQLEAAMSAARRQGARAQEGRLLSNLGLAYAALGDAAKAIGLYELALSIAQESGDGSGEGNVLGNLGGTHSDDGDTAQAIVYYQRALTIKQAAGDQRGEANTLSNLGLAYADLGDTAQAIVYYQRALTIKQAAGDQHGEANTLSNLGLAYADLGKTDQAVEHCERALAIIRDLGDRRGEGMALGNLADVYALQDNFGRAIECYEQSLTIRREVGDLRGAASSSWNLGLLLERQGDLERAVAHMQACVDFERETKHPAAEQDAIRLNEVRQRLLTKTTDESETDTKP
jgi:tetratricopeptide (TPR) repeat protein